MAAEGPRHVYRSTFWRGVAWLWLPFALFMMWDVVRRDWTRDSLVAFVVVGAISSLVFAVGWRPAVIGDNERLVVRNPFRTATVPWNAVEEIDVTDALRVHTRLATVRAWAVDRGGGAVNSMRGMSNRVSQARAGQDAVARVRMSPAERALETLTELWRQRQGQTRGVAVIRWSWPTIAAVLLLVGASVYLIAT